MSPLELLREQIKKKLTERVEAQDAMDAVLEGAQQRGDGDLLAGEQRKFNALRRSITNLDAEILELRGQEHEMTGNERARDAAEAAQRRYGDHGGSTRPVPARVNSEPQVYDGRGEHSFIRDALARFSDPAAAARIERSQREALVEHRASVGTAGFGALVVPQYLDTYYAEVLRAGRPFLNVISSDDLPDEGMTLNIPRGTTGTVVLQQTTENTAVASVTFDETTLAVPVNTYAGDQDVSRQSLDRGRNTDRIIMQDLASAYVQKLDADGLTGPGTNGRHLGILSTTNGVTTVTFSGTATETTAMVAHAKIADGIQRITSTRFLPPDVIVMHPRRWGWFLAARDTQGRPLVVPEGQGVVNALGEAVNGAVGTLLGLPVVTDANIPTTVSSSTISGSTEDQILITRTRDVHIFEDSPGPTVVEFRETLAGQLTVKVVAWGYSAFTAGRYPSATAIVSGSSLTTPVFS